MKTVVVLNRETMGRGDDTLGGVLIDKLLLTLADMPEKPVVMAFYNSGVRLMCDGSPVLEPLRQLQAAGVELLACGTCLDYLRPARAHRGGPGQQHAGDHRRHADGGQGDHDLGRAVEWPAIVIVE